MNWKLLSLLAPLLAVVALTAAPAASAAPLPSATLSASVKVLDSAATINDPAWFTKAYDAGFRLYVMHSTAWGTCTPWSNTQAQLGMALAAGLKIAVYTRDPSCWQGGITAAGRYQSQLQFFALDVETGGSVVTRAMVDGVKGMGVRPVIYTGSGMWPQMTNDSKAFSDVPLWDTNTGNIPAPIEYGGWNTPATMRIGVQEEFDRNLNGVVIDISSFDSSFLR